MGLFSTLNTGTSALNASQVAVATTSQNIANQDNTSYTRQRVNLAASSAVSSGGVSVGTGVTVTSVTRVHDEFTYAQLKKAATAVSYDTYTTQTLEEVSTYFPDLDESGIAVDLEEYFAAWSDLASNATEGSQKIALVQSALTMTSDIQSTRESLRDLQDSVNSQLKTSIDEINSIASQIADINKQINAIESEAGNYANDLRDARDELELTLANLVDISVSKGSTSSYTSSVSADLSSSESSSTEYSLNIAGYTIIDGSTYHPLVASNSSNTSGYYSVYYETQDGKQYDLTGKISGGKVGAMLDLRGRALNGENGYPTDGTIQDYIDELDTFAQTLITATNNIYAQSAQSSMQSPILDISGNTSLKNAYENIESGTFDVIVYDSSGLEVGRKTITIGSTTTMTDNTFSDSIVSQINSSTDDNSDNNSLNDVDDYFTAIYMEDGTFSLSPTTNNSGYTIAIEDNGTNFPGAIGISQFLTGTDASDISVATQYQKDPSSMAGFAAPTSGDNTVANAMVQLQYDSLSFYNNGLVTSGTLDGYYTSLTTHIASEANAADSSLSTNSTLYNTAYTEFQSTSGVNEDEELANLIMYQASYTAAAKIITTIDEMLDTLLGMKS
ncbi:MULTISPECIES: flagellar hook-associated protein FlgK [unclassified Sulfurospirillum]|uniref:flagellar hook-associated protein FlgK n=1 Tax=unclassified Sulfurospirillum TaxID=2618290 RepID=UPI0005017B0D|nr:MULTISPECIES: flagellar hook-associated protein FlgK [unclassified Sulfurospirillum]KFL35352.1 flagellar hook protein FlgK [Sulfurospirillum sp. SCADC]